MGKNMHKLYDFSVSKVVPTKSLPASKLGFISSFSHFPWVSLLSSFLEANKVRLHGHIFFVNTLWKHCFKTGFLWESDIKLSKSGIKEENRYFLGLTFEVISPNKSNLTSKTLNSLHIDHNSTSEALFNHFFLCFFFITEDCLQVKLEWLFQEEAFLF